MIVKVQFIDSLITAPKALENTIQYGLVNTIAKVSASSELKQDIKRTIENLNEMIELIKSSYSIDMQRQLEQPKQRTRHLQNNLIFVLVNLFHPHQNDYYSDYYYSLSFKMFEFMLKCILCNKVFDLINF